MGFLPLTFNTRFLKWFILQLKNALFLTILNVFSKIFNKIRNDRKTNCKCCLSLKIRHLDKKQLY